MAFGNGQNWEESKNLKDKSHTARKLMTKEVGKKGGHKVMPGEYEEMEKALLEIIRYFSQIPIPSGSVVKKDGIDSPVSAAPGEKTTDTVPEAPPSQAKPDNAPSVGPTSEAPVITDPNKKYVDEETAKKTYEKIIGIHNSDDKLCGKTTQLRQRLFDFLSVLTYISGFEEQIAFIRKIGVTDEIVSVIEDIRSSEFGNEDVTDSKYRNIVKNFADLIEFSSKQNMPEDIKRIILKSEPQEEGPVIIIKEPENHDNSDEEPNMWKRIYNEIICGKWNISEEERG
jgi:hypothetical protein